MFRTRNLLSAAFGSVLLLVMAGPAFAGPAPLDDAPSGGARLVLWLPGSASPVPDWIPA